MKARNHFAWGKTGREPNRYYSTELDHGKCDSVIDILPKLYPECRVYSEPASLSEAGVSGHLRNIFHAEISQLYHSSEYEETEKDKENQIIRIGK